MLDQSTADVAETNRVLQSIKETSLRATTFADAAHGERVEDYPFAIHLSYLPYSLYQAAIVQYRLSKQTGDPTCKRHLDVLKGILREFTKRWMGVCKFNLYPVG